jgi:hypothetical protein
MTVKILLSSALVAAALSGSAQSRNTTYAITGDGNRDFVWMNIRQVDMTTGQITRTVFQRSTTPYLLSEVTDAKHMNALTPTDNLGSREYPTGSLVAAAAFDKKYQRLYFIPMRNPELRWLDLNSKSDNSQFYTLRSDVLRVGNMNDEANHVTRMTIASDGNMYALTNDGNHLYRISTGKTPTITDLGNVVDADESALSIHSKCTSWGGDMVADANGNLYVVTANQHIFEINPQTRIATHKGSISGLPAGYTTNAAAVTEDNKIMLASANVFAGYYTISLDDLNAVKMEGSDVTFNASDFANGNVLFEKEAQTTLSGPVTMNLPELPAPGTSKVYPNPVTGNNFNVMLNAETSGKYMVVLTDLTGRIMQTNTINLLKGAQTQNIRVRSRSAKGMFFVKVIDENNQTIMTEKIMIQ